MVDIRLFEERDWTGTWRIIEPVVRAGETYSFSPDITQAEGHKVWIQAPAATFVALDNHGAVAGTYYIKPNQPGLGAHVCNCGYIVAEDARGSGIASAMCDHSHDAASTGAGRRSVTRRWARAWRASFRKEIGR